MESVKVGAGSSGVWVGSNRAAVGGGSVKVGSTTKVAVGMAVTSMFGVRTVCRSTVGTALVGMNSANAS